MDEDLIIAIQKRGYDPDVMIAILEGLRSGHLYRVAETHNAKVMRVMSPKYAKSEENKSKETITKRSTYSCTCAGCGAKIQTYTCPKCFHDNYEILAIKGGSQK